MKTAPPRSASAPKATSPRTLPAGAMGKRAAHGMNPGPIRLSGGLGDLPVAVVDAAFGYEGARSELER